MSIVNSICHSRMRWNGFTSGPASVSGKHTEADFKQQFDLALENLRKEEEAVDIRQASDLRLLYEDCRAYCSARIKDIVQSNG